MLKYPILGRRKMAFSGIRIQAFLLALSTLLAAGPAGAGMHPRILRQAEKEAEVYRLKNVELAEKRPRHRGDRAKQ